MSCQTNLEFRVRRSVKVSFAWLLKESKVWNSGIDISALRPCPETLYASVSALLAFCLLLVTISLPASQLPPSASCAPVIRPATNATNGIDSSFGISRISYRVSPCHSSYSHSHLWLHDDTHGFLSPADHKDSPLSSHITHNVDPASSSTNRWQAYCASSPCRAKSLLRQRTNLYVSSIDYSWHSQRSCSGTLVARPSSCFAFSIRRSLSG